VLHALPGGLDVSVVGSTDVDLLEPGAFVDLIEGTRPATVVHLAWVASSTPDYRTSTENARWRAVTREAASAAVESGIHFIATGSAVDGSPGADPYTAAKAGLRSDLDEDIANGRITWVRPHYVFDPGTPSPAVLRMARDAQERGEAVHLRAPYAEHDFVHVRDVGDAVAAVVEHRLTGVVDIGFGILTAVHTLVERFGAAWAQAPGPVATALTDSAADIRQLVRIGWHPTETERFFS
jgi:nucleoside-diphosphate-sugar epimerase